jgi:7-cyano-7-deazaguanine synthase
MSTTITTSTLRSRGKVADSVIALSGGIDSTTTLAFAIETNYRPIAIVFDYGQTHLYELNSAKAVAAHYEIPIHVCKLDIPLLQSTLIANSGVSAPNAGIPTFVPGRNLMMLSVLSSIAQSNGIFHMFIGIQKDEGYSDTTPQWLKQIRPAFPEVNAHAPLVHLNKIDVVHRAIGLGVPLHLTRSCYSPSVRPCLRCRSCLNRTRAFLANNQVDAALSPLEWTEAVHIVISK